MIAATTHPWSFWIAVVLVVSGIGAVARTAVMYFKKVVSPRFPKD